MKRGFLQRYLTPANVGRVRDFFVAEYAILIAVGLASALAFMFFSVADEVTEGETHELDTAILDLFRAAGDPSQMIGSFWFHEAVRDITALGSMSVLALIVISVVVYLIIVGKTRAGLLVGASVMGGSILSTLLKNIFDRPRPEYSTIAQELSASFPSGHTMLAAVAYLTLGALLARLTPDWRVKIYFYAVAVILTVLVGISRVILGVHYPSDVLAGWALGAAWALGASAIASVLRRRGMV